MSGIIRKKGLNPQPKKNGMKLLKWFLPTLNSKHLKHQQKQAKSNSLNNQFGSLFPGLPGVHENVHTVSNKIVNTCTCYFNIAETLKKENKNTNLLQSEYTEKAHFKFIHKHTNIKGSIDKGQFQKYYGNICLFGNLSNSYFASIILYILKKQVLSYKKKINA